MEAKESIVVILTYKKSDRDLQEKVVNAFSKIQGAEKSTVEVVYRGSNEKAIAALKSLLELAK